MERQIERKKSFSQRLLNALNILCGDGNDRRSGAAETNAQKVRMFQRKGFFEARHKPLPKRLMHAVLQSFSEQREIAGMQGLQKQGNALEVEYGIVA